MGRKYYSNGLKSRIALDAIKGQKTIAELASEYGVHANQISPWRKQLLDTQELFLSSLVNSNANQRTKFVFFRNKT